MNVVMTGLEGRNGTGLRAPVRNRYFYGKLLDVEQLELEQRYFLDMSRLVNRLTLGAGVLCGLRVRVAQDGTLLVSPGVAVDGLGREILVTETVQVPLATLAGTAAGGDGGSPFAGEGAADAVLCLSYHECPVDPAPVLVADCDLREDCVPGAIRERFRLALVDPADAPWPEDPCSVGGRRKAVPATIAEAGLDEAAFARRLERAIGRLDPGYAARPAQGPAAALREQLCGSYQPPCAPGSACVPIALLRRDAAGAVTVDECAPRTTIYSNAVLLDLILCLAERLDECCGRRVTVAAPRIVELSPAPGQAVKQSDFDRLGLKGGGIAVSFDTTMSQQRLEQPSSWLRVLLMAQQTTGTTTKVVAFPVKLTLDHIDAKTLSGGSGQTAYYTFEIAGAAGAGKLAASLKRLNLSGIGFFVQARADDVTQITADADPHELLDADYAGTVATPEVLDLLWLAAAVPALSLAIPNPGPLLTPPSPLPPLDDAHPSGNGVEGGVFHSTFAFATG